MMLLWILLAVAPASARIQMYDCVQLQGACEQFPGNKSLRVIAVNPANCNKSINDCDHYYVGDVKDVDAGFAFCPCERMTLIQHYETSSESCGDFDPTQPLMRDGFAVLLFLTSWGFYSFFSRCEKESAAQIVYVVAYWTYDFGVGLAAYIFLAGMCLPPLTRGLSWRAMLVAILVESIGYDWPLLIVKNYWPKRFGIAIILCGSFWNAAAIFFAYYPPIVMVLGQHLVIYGIYQWILDILKFLAERFAWKKIRGQAVEGPYALLQEELTPPVPA